MMVLETFYCLFFIRFGFFTKYTLKGYTYVLSDNTLSSTIGIRFPHSCRYLRRETSREMFITDVT